MISKCSFKGSDIFSAFPKYDLKKANTVNKNESTVKKAKKKILFGSTLASTIITVGIIGMVFAKGPHGSSLNKLTKLTDRLSEKIFESNHSQNSKGLKKLIYYGRKGFNYFFEGLQAISNFTAIKDYSANKVLRKNKLTSKFADTSTNKFKKIIDKTLGKKYDRAEVKIKDLSSLIRNFNTQKIVNLTEKQRNKKIKIKSKTFTLQEWVEKLSKHADNLESAFDSNFSMGARKFRGEKRWKLLDNVPSQIKNRFFNKNNIFNLNNYKTYVTQDVSSTAKKQLENEIMTAKKKITNNIPSIHESVLVKLNNFAKNIKPEDNINQKTIQSIKENMNKFKACSGEYEAIGRNKIISTILEQTSSIKNALINDSKYSANEKKDLLKYLNNIEKTISNVKDNSKGALEEIMTIVNGLSKSKEGKLIVSQEEFKDFQKLSKKITKNIEKAVNLESGEYFLKEAELKVGSAPTDVLSILFPAGAGAYAIATGDNKDERISKTLTTCIPLIGTFATFVYGTTKMLSGAKNLGFTLITGAILSKLGSYCDKLYKEYKKSGSIVNVVKDEYNHLVTDITPEDFFNAKSKKVSKS